MSEKTVLVTGINGYIGSHIGLQLLRKGYTVRGTSRSSLAKDHLLNEAFKGFEKQYEHFAVPNIVEAGAFDHAVLGVHGIIHVASPIDFSLPNLEAFLGPAAGGVESILNSAQKAGPQFKSFVMTSSIVAVLDTFRHPADHIYDDSDWNTTFEPMARKEFSATLAYGASKTLAERTMWTWRDKHQPAFTLTAINPGLVLGPPIAWPASPNSLNESVTQLWKIFSGEAETIPAAIALGSVVDVRDTAALHIWCLEHNNAADGGRYIAVTGKMPPQAYSDLIREHYPDREILIGKPGQGYVPGTYQFIEGEGGFIADKMFTALGGGSNLIDPARMILDTIRAFEQRWPDAVKNHKSKKPGTTEQTGST